MQGVSPHVAAKTILEVMALGQWGHSQQTQLAGLNNHLKNWQKSGSRRFRGKITMARLRATGEWPVLKAKAACTRHIIRYCLKIV